jgi:hypothetical protein
MFHSTHHNQIVHTEVSMSQNQITNETQQLLEDEKLPLAPKERRKEFKNTKTKTKHNFLSVALNYATTTILLKHENFVLQKTFLPPPPVQKSIASWGFCSLACRKIPMLGQEKCKSQGSALLTISTR